MNKPIKNRAASVRARLKNLAEDDNRPFSEILQYYAMERFLSRLARSRHRDHFVLKGALMLQLWGGARSRSTKDIDLWGQNTVEPAELVNVVQECLAISIEDDGVQFLHDTVAAESIRVDAHYDGVRLRFQAKVDTARIHLQVDVGFGDVITPNALEVHYPSLLGFEPPRLLGYTRESMIAEKFEAIVALDMANTRMKDFFDIWLLSQRETFSSEILGRAIEATFRRRRTSLPTSPPTALRPEFHASPDKQRQWKAYLRKGRVLEDVPELDAVATCIRDFLMPVVESRAAGNPFEANWPPGGPWDRHG